MDDREDGLVVIAERAPIVLPPPPPPMELDEPPIELSPDQEAALDVLVNSPHNVFLTGAAGSGKSLVLTRAVEALQKRHGRKHVIVTASTGVAAASIGGITLHSFAGVGIEELSVRDAVHIHASRRCLIFPSP